MPTPLQILLDPISLTNPKEFVSESGFEGAASAQIPQMLVFRDIAASDFAQSVQPSRQGAA